MPLNRIFLFCLLNMYLMTHAMQIEVFLQAQDRDAQEIQIPLEIAKISSTIKSVIEDQNDPTTTKIIVPLAAINSKLLSECLIPCINAQQAGDPEKIIATKINALSLPDLSSFIQAVNYLDIQPLFTKAHEIAHAKLKAANAKRPIMCFKNLNDIEHSLAYSLVKSCPIYNFVSNAPKILKKHSGPAEHLCFSKNNKLLATTADDHTVNFNDGTIGIWDTQTGTCIRTLNEHTKTVQALCFSPDSSLLASGSGDGTAKLWDMATGTCLHSFKKHVYCDEPSNVWYVTFNHAGSLLATCACNDPNVYLWDTKTGKYITAFTGTGRRDRAATHCCFNHDSSILAVAYWNKIELWDLNTYTHLISPTEEHISAIIHLYFSADGKQLISGSRRGDVSIWDVQTGKRLQYFDSPNTRGHHLFPGCYNSLNNNLAIYQPDTDRDIVHVLDLSTASGILSCKNFCASSSSEEWLLQSAYFDNKRSLLIMCSSNGNRYTASLANDCLPKESFTNTYQSYLNEKVVSLFSEDGSLLALGCKDGAVRLFNFADKSLEYYLDHQLTIDQALFLTSFYEKFIKNKKVLLCPYGHEYKTYLSLDERVKKALEPFIIAKCSWTCQIGHYKKPLILGAVGTAAFGGYLFYHFMQKNKHSDS